MDQRRRAWNWGGGEGGEREAWEAPTGATLPGRAWPQLPTLTWSAGCAWLALAPGVGCCSCFMAVIAGGPRWRSLPRGHFRLRDCHLAAIACHRSPTLSELAEGKAAATGWGEGSDREEKRGTEQAPPCKIPPSATADPRTPHSPRPPPLQSVESLGDLTRPSGKLVEQREAPDRARATSHSAGGARLAFYRSPRPPPAPGGSPRRAQCARWSSPAPRSSISGATATRERALCVASFSHARPRLLGSAGPLTPQPPPPAGSC